VAPQSTRDPAQRRLLLLTAILFVSYLCVAMAIPIVKSKANFGRRPRARSRRSLIIGNRRRRFAARDPSFAPNAVGMAGRAALSVMIAANIC
jgi:hypothetical protein